MYLCSDVVKDGQQHRVEDARPELCGEGRAMELEGVEQNLQAAVPVCTNQHMLTLHD